jgi:DNA (cytosine-5)-methyltransferase 1
MKKFNPDLSPELQQELQEISDKIARMKDLKRYKSQRELSAAEDEEYSALLAEKSALFQRVGEFLVPLKDLILEKIASIGYRATYKVLNSVDYGVPQKRERVIFIGSQDPRLLDDIFPAPTHKGSTNQTLDSYLDVNRRQSMLPWVTVREAIDDLKDAPQSEQFSQVYTRHSPAFVSRIQNVQPGENLYANYSDAWYRLLPDQAARTVKENHGGVFLHYDRDRCLTPRELARLQSFPDDFLFKGTKSEILKQVGNAVPPLLAKAIAGKLANFLN